MSPDGNGRGRFQRPLGVTILALLQILTGVQLLVSFLFYVSLSSWVKTPDGQAALLKLNSQWLAQNASGLLFLLAMAYLILGASSLLLARGYVKGKGWARRRGRLLAILAILFAIFGAIILPNRLDPGSPFWTVAFNAVVFIYLGRPKVKAYFGVRR